MMGPARPWIGVARSLRIYRLDPAHCGRLRALYAPFVAPGALVFDIGAHVGDRVAAFRALGARVVAVEPQARLAWTLRRLHGRDPGVTILRAAVAATPGEVTLRVNRANPTVSTLSDAFIDDVAAAPGWRGQRWDGAERVPATTLDALIAVHGAPSFIKIDVEGHEEAALQGLAQPPAALSFEVVTAARGAGRRALARAAALRFTAFRLSLGESGRWTGGWVGAAAMDAALAALPEAANSGDVYCRR